MREEALGIISEAVHCKLRGGSWQGRQRHRNGFIEVISQSGKRKWLG